MKILKRILKIVLGIIAVLLILMVLGYFALTRWINPNIFKPQIVSMVQQETGRSVTLTGDLSWRVFPDIGIHIGEAALSNPAGFSQPTFASIQSADLLISLSALLNGDVRVESLTVNGLQVFLITSKTGSNNWSFSLPSAPTTSTNTQSQINFKMKALNLNNATVTYDNLQNNAHYVLSNFDLNIPKVRLDKPITLKAMGDFNTENLASNFKLNTDLFYNSTKEKLTLNNLALNTHINYITNSNQNISLVLNLSGNVLADFANEIVNLTGIQFTLNQVLNGQLTATIQNFNNLAYSGTIVLPAFSLEPLLNSFGQNLPNIPNKDQFANTELQTNFAGGLNKLSLQNMNLGVGDTTVQGALNFTSFEPFAVNENLTINQIDLADFTNLSGARLPMTGISLNGNASIAGFDPQDFPSTFNASQKIVIQDIILKGFDLGAVLDQVSVILQNVLNVKKVSDAEAAIQNEVAQLQQTTINADNGKQTDFGKVNAEVLVRHGVITTPIMTIAGPLLAATGQGTIDLNKQVIDYHLNGKILSIDKNIIKTLNIPYNITGPFNNITQGVDMASVQSQIVAFIMGQVGQTVKSVFTTVVGAPVDVVGGIGKGVAGVFGHIFGGDKAAASS